MGLLEKVQEKKISDNHKNKISNGKNIDKKQKNVGLLDKVKHKQVTNTTNKKREYDIKSQSLLDKVKQKEEKSTVEKTKTNIDNTEFKNKTQGLLEKVKQKEQTTEEKLIPYNETKELDNNSQGLLEKVKQKEQTIEEKQIIIHKGLLEKAEQKKNYTKSEKTDLGKKEVIELRKGFGWRGLGTRKIVFNHLINEYVYEVTEPILSDFELEKKEELSRLFKMLADINITSLEKEEKEEYLEKTLEQIIQDNNIKFAEKNKPKSKEKNTKNKEKKSLKDLFSKKGKEQKDKDKKTKGKNPFSNLFSKKDKVQKEKDKKTKGKNPLSNLFSKKDKVQKEKDKKTKGKNPLKNLFLKNKEGAIKNKKKFNILKINKKHKNKINLNKEQLTELEQKSKDKIFYHVFREFLGYGKIDIIMEDEGIEDISCDGHHVPVFIYHKKYDAISSNIKFDDEKELNSFVVRLAQICGKQISIYSPIVDGKLPDGSRLQTTLARTVTRGSTFTIRKFKENPLTPVDLIAFQSLSLEMAAYFWMAIERGASILFCGGTASGKTTALNALSLFILPQSKIITIEDTREINLPHKNWIAGTTRQGFSVSDEKTGKDIDMFDLIRAALRQRPKVIMVGEVRGKEAYSLFQAMATGHTSYATVHASDIHTLIQRLENPPISLPRALLTSLDVIVFQNAVDISGKTVRRMTSVTEIVKLDTDTNQLIFMEPFRWISKTDDRFDSSGSSKILNTIRLQNDWTEDQLKKELDNRKLILQWMHQKDIRDYMEVGHIVSEYIKNPEKLLKKAREEVKD